MCLNETTSGNRRSEINPEGTAATQSNEVPTNTLPNTPKISERTFTAPAGVPIKKTPSIKEILEISHTPVHSAMSPISSQPEMPTDDPHGTPSVQQPSDEKTATEEEKTSEKTMTSVEKTFSKESMTSKTDSVTPPQEESAASPPTNSPEQFPALWKQLFTDLFEKEPMLYFPLKDTIPTYQDRVIYIAVLNDFQKEGYEQKKRDILEYWRRHFNLDVEDIVISVNKNIEIKKVIYSSEDKLRYLEEQNPQLHDFLNIVNVKIID